MGYAKLFLYLLLDFTEELLYSIRIAFRSILALHYLIFLQFPNVLVKILLLHCVITLEIIN